MQTSAGTSDSDDSDEDTPESPNLKRNRDGTIASGTKEELRLAYELAKDPWGRFGGRNGKLARIRAQEAALAGKLKTFPFTYPCLSFRVLFIA